MPDGSVLKVSEPNPEATPGHLVTIAATLAIVTLAVAGSVFGDRAYRRWSKKNQFLAGSLERLKQIRATYAQRTDDAREMASTAKSLATEIQHARRQ